MNPHHNTTNARVRYDARPTAATLPPTSTDVTKLNANELRSLRALVDDALQADRVQDTEVLEYIRLQERAQQRIDAIEARAAYTAASQPAPAPTAPAYLRSVGDSHAGLADAFSVSRAILAAAEGRSQVGAEAEVIAEGRRSNPRAGGNVVLPGFIQKRNVYGSTAGGSIDAAVSGKQTISAPMLTANHGEPMLQGLGATVLTATGAGTFLVPYLGRTDAASAGEGAALTSSATFSQLELTPTRYGRRTDVSALALRTNGSAIDQLLLQDFSASHAWAADVAGFNAIRNGATFTAATETGTDDLAVTTLANILDLVADTMSAIRSNAAPTLVCSPIGYEVLNSVVATSLAQTLAQAYFTSTGGRTLPAVGMVDADIPAEKALASVAASREFVGAGLVAAGFFPDLVIARWGEGVDLMVDPYTDADNAVIRVIANSYTAAGLVRDSFRCLAVTATTLTDSAV